MALLQNFCFKNKILFDLVYLEYELVSSLHQVFSTDQVNPFLSLSMSHIQNLHQYVLQYSHLNLQQEKSLRDKIGHSRGLWQTSLFSVIQRYCDEKEFTTKQCRRLIASMKEAQEYCIEKFQRIFHLNEKFVELKKDHLLQINQRLTDLLSEIRALFSDLRKDRKVCTLDFEELLLYLCSTIQGCHDYINTQQEE